MVLVYAFSNRWGTNAARRVLNEWEKISQRVNWEFRPVYFYPQEFFRKQIEGRKPVLIVGLGDGLGERVRIETRAKNSYNERPIEALSPIWLDLSMPEVDNIDGRQFEISGNMGSFNCNWMAYKIEWYIRRHNLETRQLFLHIPRRILAGEMAGEIERLVKENEIV